MAILKATITGATPLIMHNSRLANKLNPYTIAIAEFTGKRKKTDSDHHEIARLEWEGGLYFAPDIGPYVPSENLLSMIIGGAKRQKLGTAFKPAIFIHESRFPLHYDGPRDVAGLWERHERFMDMRIVVISRQRIMRARPIFPDWSLDFVIDYDDQQINRGQLVKAIEDSGVYVGLGDNRPRYGRFSVTDIVG